MLFHFLLNNCKLLISTFIAGAIGFFSSFFSIKYNNHLEKKYQLTKLLAILNKELSLIYDKEDSKKEVTNNTFITEINIPVIEILLSQNILDYKKDFELINNLVELKTSISNYNSFNKFHNYVQINKKLLSKTTLDQLDQIQILLRENLMNVKRDIIRYLENKI